MSRLYIAAKAPRPGFVKTRLARDLGAEPATRLYRAFLRDLGAQFPTATWLVTPDTAWPEVAAAAEAGPRATAAGQGSGTWAQRQDRLFATTSPTRRDPVVLIGSDSPQVTPGSVARAFSLLAGHDLVLGPVRDGGYWLVGMSGYHDFLAEIPMSTPHVLSSVLVEAYRRRLSVALLEPEFDVDEVSDLCDLDAAAAGGRLPATGAELATLRRLAS